MKIVAITSCPTGVAHTYMAAEKLTQGAKALGHEINVETQGATGIENRLTDQQIKDADLVIFATEVTIREEERFNGKKIFRCPVVAPIKDVNKVLADAEKKAKIEKMEKVENKKKRLSSHEKSLKQHILTGVSYIIPIVIAASVMMGIARIGGMALGVTDIWNEAYMTGGGLLQFFAILDKLGGIGLGLMLPILAGFIAYSYADKPGLASGFIGGMIASQFSAGFFGALLAGIFAGIFTRWLVENINLSGAARSLGPVFLIPVLSVLTTSLVTYFIIVTPFAMFNEFLITALSGMSSGSAVLMAIILGAMVGFDLGGPVNKAAVVTAMGLLESAVYLPNTAVQVAIIIPVLGYGIATIIRGSTFSESFRDAGYASTVMGLVGVSEGAIPFTLAKPKVFIFMNMLGCAVGAAIAVGFGAVNTIPISGIYGWLLVDNWGVYVLGIFVGAAIVALGAIMNKSAFATDEADGII